MPKYCIQKHSARNLHYDLRLEKDGAAKSWALPKEPDLSSRRLAVQVDDHSVDYMDFEGKIAEGEYGAGKVEMWDKGIYDLIDYKPDKKYILDIHGNKLKGKFVLLRFKDKNWLFFKKK